MEDTTTARLVTEQPNANSPHVWDPIPPHMYIHYMALRGCVGGELTSMKGRAEPWARDTYESVKWMIVSATPAFAIK